MYDEFNDRFKELNIESGTYAGGYYIKFLGTNVVLLYNAKEKRVDTLQIHSKIGFRRQEYGEKFKSLFEKADLIFSDISILLDGPDSMKIEKGGHDYRCINRTLDAYLG